MGGAEHVYTRGQQSATESENAIPLILFVALGRQNNLSTHSS